jgi:hypothetical protein
MIFLIQDALLVLGLLAGVGLFLSAKRELRREAHKRQQAVEELAAQLASLAQKISQPSLEPLETRPLRVTTSKGHSGFNLNWRVQALRLLRRGQDIAHVSAVLGVSRREIELLIRVQQLVTTRPASGTK